MKERRGDSEFLSTDNGKAECLARGRIGGRHFSPSSERRLLGRHPYVRRRNRKRRTWESRKLRSGPASNHSRLFYNDENIAARRSLFHESGCTRQTKGRDCRRNPAAQTVARFQSDRKTIYLWTLPGKTTRLG